MKMLFKNNLIKDNLIYWCLLWCFLLFSCCQMTMAKVEESQNVNRTSRNDLTVDKFITELVDYIFNPTTESQGRTFGIKRIQFMMLPMVFKMGVMMTMLVILTVISLKGLTIGIVLLVLKLATIFGKLYSMLKPQQQVSWAPSAQPVNVHFHAADGYHNHHPYGGYEGPSNMGQDHHFYHRRRTNQELPYFI